MNDAGGDLKEIKEAVNGITAHLIAKDRSEGSVLTAYPDDDKAIWKEFRRELISDGFSSSVIGKHKHLIKAYIGELGARGLLDDADPQPMNEPTAHDPSVIEDASPLVAFKDADAADSQSSIKRAAEAKGRYIQTTAKTSPDPLLDLGEQSNADRSSMIDSKSDTESQVQPKEEDIVAAQSVTSVTETQEELEHTTHIKRLPRPLLVETRTWDGSGRVFVFVRKAKARECPSTFHGSRIPSLFYGHQVWILSRCVALKGRSEL